MYDVFGSRHDGGAKRTKPESGLYVARDESERVLYIGKSVNLRLRLQSHNPVFGVHYRNTMYKLRSDRSISGLLLYCMPRSQWWPVDIFLWSDFFEIAPDDHDWINDVEKALIGSYKPPLNVEFNGKFNLFPREYADWVSISGFGDWRLTKRTTAIYNSIDVS